MRRPDRPDAHPPTSRAAGRIACGRATLLTILVAAASIPASSQPITLSEDDNEKVQLAGQVAQKIPYVGPFLSAGTKLLFGAAERKTDAELQAMWQSYTDTQLSAAHVSHLRGLLNGYYAIVQEIDAKKRDETRAEARYPDRQLPVERRRLYREQRIELWERLDDQILSGIESIRQQSGEGAGVAGQILPIMAAAAELRLLAKDRLIALASVNDAGQVDGGFDQDAYTARQDEIERLRATYLQERDRLLHGDWDPACECGTRSLNALLGDQIEAASRERADQIVVHDLALDFVRNVTDSGSGEVRSEIREGRIFYVADTGSPGVEGERVVSTVYKANPFVGPGGAQTREEAADCVVPPGFPQPPYGCIAGLDVATARAMAEADMRQRREELYEYAVELNRRRFILQDVVTLQVSNLTPSLTDSLFTLVFGNDGRRVSLLQYAETDQGLRYWLADWGDAPPEYDWRPTGRGYFQTESYNARFWQDHWHSEAGKAKARGETGLKRVLTEGDGVVLEEVRVPYIWSWNFLTAPAWLY